MFISLSLYIYIYAVLKDTESLVLSKLLCTPPRAPRAPARWISVFVYIVIVISLSLSLSLYVCIYSVIVTICNC